MAKDSKSIRKKTLFWRLRFRGFDVPNAISVVERAIEHEGMVRLFGAIEFSKQSISPIVNLMDEEPCSYIVSLSDFSGAADPVIKGWERCNTVPFQLLEDIVEREGLFVKAFGEFDDPEGGYVVFAKPVIVEKLMRKCAIPCER